MRFSGVLFFVKIDLPASLHLGVRFSACRFVILSETVRISIYAAYGSSHDMDSFRQNDKAT